MFLKNISFYNIYIIYIAGTTAFFVCMHYYPEFNDKIELMVAMAPATTLAHTRAMILRYLHPVQRLIQVFKES